MGQILKELLRRGKFDGDSDLEPACAYLLSGGDGSAKEKWHLPAFYPRESCLFSPHPQAEQFISSLFVPGAFELLPQCLSSERVHQQVILGASPLKGPPGTPSAILLTLRTPY